MRATNTADLQYIILPGIWKMVGKGQSRSVGEPREERIVKKASSFLFYVMVPWWLSGKEFCQCRRRGFDPWVGKIPWRKKWQPMPVLLPGKSHGQRSLVGGL